MNRIRIVSDGTAVGTYVFDADGKRIEAAISAIEWGVTAGGIGEVKITFPFPAVDVSGELKDG